MALGSLQNEGDLRRFIEQELQRPENSSAPAPPIALVKDGAPTDDDFPNPPLDGIFAYDREAEVLYGRIDGDWAAL
jgi:hypothetical protein